MYIFLLLTGYLVGLAVFSFTIIQILIILRVGIPLTRSFTTEGLLITPNPIFKHHCISIVVLLSIFILAIWLLNKFSGEAFAIGFYVGSAFSFFKGIGQTGRNETNVKEFISGNARYLTRSTDNVKSTT